MTGGPILITGHAEQNDRDECAQQPDDGDPYDHAKIHFVSFESNDEAQTAAL